VLRLLFANFHNKGYGQPTAVFLLARALQERGHEVTVASPPGSVLEQRSDHAGIETFSQARFLRLKNLLSTASDIRALRRHLISNRPDIIHTNGSQDTWAMALARRPLSPRIPLVMSRHNSMLVHGGFSNRWLYGSALDHLVLTSSAIQTQYRSLVDQGVITAERMTVIHPPFDLAVFDRAYDRSLLHRELSLAPDTPILGLVGRLHVDKGHRILIRALPAVLARHPRVHTVFIGSGESDEEAALKTEVTQAGLAERVTFLGFRPDIADITASLTISVLPTTGTDSSPTVLKEALCLTVPVVAADTGGVREVIDDGETGYVVQKHDHDGLAQALIRLLDDPERSHAMAQEGARRVRERFSPQACAIRHEQLYKQLLQRPVR
jgi:glycosyltransferase involved in cell wall biosynthesis